METHSSILSWRIPRTEEPSGLQSMGSQRVGQTELTKHHLCILATSSWYLLLLLSPYCFCPLLCTYLQEIFPWYLQFSWRDLQSFPFYCFALFLCIGHWGRLSCLSLVFSGTVHSVGYISFAPLLFASLLCKAYSDNHFAFLQFFFFGMVLVTTYCTMLWNSVHSSIGTLCTRSNLLNLFVTSTVQS